MVVKQIDITKGPTDKQKEMLMQALKNPITYDEDSPFLSDEDLKEFRRIAKQNRDDRRKQTISLRLSPQAAEKARSLGKGYTSILARILEIALQDNEIIKKAL